MDFLFKGLDAVFGTDTHRLLQDNRPRVQFIGNKMHAWARDFNAIIKGVFDSMSTFKSGKQGRMIIGISWLLRGRMRKEPPKKFGNISSYCRMMP